MIRATTPTAGPRRKWHHESSRFSLARLRSQFTTQLFTDTRDVPPPEPPDGVFELVRYPAPLGANWSYISAASKGPRRPAIIWIAGGFNWGIDSGSWTESPRKNDQSAATFRNAGIVLMRPSLRGAHDNAGRNECFLGEVGDVGAGGVSLHSRSRPL